MAKAAEIEGLAYDDTYRAAAAEVVEVRAGELFAQAENVLDTSDIERVHDMRVATRRLRAVLEIFAPCFPRPDYRGVLRDVKGLADALGERRDPDVHIDALSRLADSVPGADRPGIESLVARFRGDQAAGNEAVARALEDMDERDLAGRIAGLVAAAREDAP